MAYKTALFGAVFCLCKRYANAFQTQSSCIRFAMQMQCKIMQIKIKNKIKYK